MLVWPWTFFGVVWKGHGLKMNSHYAKHVTDNPHTTNFVVTFIASLASLIISILVSKAVIRFSRAWITRKSRTTTPTYPTLFRVSLLSGFKNHTNPWGFSDLGDLFIKRRVFPFLLVIVWMFIFTAVTPAITSLISPIPITKTENLNGTELNFASNASECVDWFNANKIDDSVPCDWKHVGDALYTTCLADNQMLNVLESGRNSMLALASNNSESLVFSQLGVKDGLHFLGPLRGVLPLGPNGVLNSTLYYPPFLDNSDPKAETVYYNYTLNLQGLNSDINCFRDNSTPLTFLPVPNTTYVFNYTGVCPPGQDILTNGTFVTLSPPSHLGFWACKAPSLGGVDQYLLYLSGRQAYSDVIGNMTCTLSPVQPAAFPVTYHSQSGYFSARNQTTTFTNTPSQLIERAIRGLAAVIVEAQNVDSNLVAESVIAAGVKSFGLQPYIQDPKYLRLYEAMFQGIIEYEATYTRLLYTTFTPPPKSCNRDVTGNVTYTVTGWSVNHRNIYFLLPMTFINLATLILVIIATYLGDKILYEFDPTDARSLVFASGNPILRDRDPEVPPTGEWLDREVNYHLRS